MLGVVDKVPGPKPGFPASDILAAEISDTLNLQMFFCRFCSIYLQYQARSQPRNTSYLFWNLFIGHWSMLTKAKIKRFFSLLCHFNTISLLRQIITL